MLWTLVAWCVLSSSPPAPMSAVSPVSPMLDVQWRDDSARTGRMLLVDIAVAATVAPFNQVAATLGAHHGVTLVTTVDRRRFKALLPIGIESKPGPQALTIDATLADGSFVRWQKPVSIGEGAYDRRTITVSRKFTSPSKSQRLRAEQE